MKGFILTRKAKSDLLEIALFTEERWGKDQRNFYIKQFDDAFHLLMKNPLAGIACDYIKNGYRKFPQGSHIIFYKNASDQTVEIIRILHKHMDIDAKFIKY
jgi:toxin ParE1/3/4